MIFAAVLHRFAATGSSTAGNAQHNGPMCMPLRMHARFDTCWHCHVQASVLGPLLVQGNAEVSVITYVLLAVGSAVARFASAASVLLATTEQCPKHCTLRNIYGVCL